MKKVMPPRLIYLLWRPRSVPHRDQSGLESLWRGEGGLRAPLGSRRLVFLFGRESGTNSRHRLFYRVLLPRLGDVQQIDCVRNVWAAGRGAALSPARRPGRGAPADGPREFLGTRGRRRR